MKNLKIIKAALNPLANVKAALQTVLAANFNIWVRNENKGGSWQKEKRNLSHDEAKKIGEQLKHQGKKIKIMPAGGAGGIEHAPDFDDKED